MEDWIKAGKIASEAREYAGTLIKENEFVLDITEKVENFILKKAQLAFPVQLAINNVAAHQTALPNDQLILKKSDLVKVDIGVSVNGCVGDTAKTFEVSTNNHKKLVEASEKALQKAIKLCSVGLEIYKIGEVIEEIIVGYGFVPIRNLSGHSIDKYRIHSGLNIPNYNNGDKRKLTKGMIIAIEPFATTGIGHVNESKPSSIYRIEQIKNIRDANARKILTYIVETHKTLPFSKREITKKFNPLIANLSLNLLEKEGILYQYPWLVEKENSLVSQTEHTLLIDDKIKILTE